jgi:FkbM family methyltransferase
MKRYRQVNLHEPEEEEWLVKIISAIKRLDDPLFVDIGSGYGYYAILVKLRVPACRIVCYEPLERHRKYLRQNWELNGLSCADLTIRADAVYRTRGQVRFARKRYGSEIVGETDATGDSGGSRVNTVRLDDEIQCLGAVSALKVDVQGAELDVLNGAASALQTQLIKSVIIGTHSGLIHDECLRILASNRYRIECEIPKPNLQPDGILVATSTDFSIE